MVDSAVGGKTAVNHPKGKNMIGAFYQPEAVIVDTDMLKSLPDRELCSGISEVIKYGLIRDHSFFEWQEANMDRIVGRDADALVETVYRSCQNKAEVVAADEKEGGVRATLNLGHTFGHAIEAGFGYGAWLHGEAVASGTAMAARMSHRQGLIDEALVDRIERLTRRANLPTSLDDNPHLVTELGREEVAARRKSLDQKVFLDLMGMDKKVADGRLSLVLLEGPLGNSIVTNKFDPQLLSALVDQYTAIPE